MRAASSDSTASSIHGLGLLLLLRRLPEDTELVDELMRLRKGARLELGVELVAVVRDLKRINRLQRLCDHI